MRTPLKRTMALVVAALALTGVAGFVAIAAFGGSSAAGAPSAAPSASQGAEMTVTGRPLYELSQTEFMFAAGQATYRVAMDIDTRCVNSRGKLLGGYQFVSRIAMITSLPSRSRAPWTARRSRPEPSFCRPRRTRLPDLCGIQA